jgi:DNA (cytosine-5)-methyltransferase 1
MTRPRLLDLFCGAGGASVGYHRAGFDVVGVDLNADALGEYPFPCVKADAMHVLAGGSLDDGGMFPPTRDVELDGNGVLPLDQFDVIHASPPCQEYSVTRNDHTRTYPRLVEPLLDWFDTYWLGDWVIENVPGAPMPDPLLVCGSEWPMAAVDDDGRELRLRRHRLFSASVPLVRRGECGCAEDRRLNRIGGVYGGGSPDRSRDNPRKNRGGYTPALHVRHALMGIDWMSVNTLSEAIPPAYTEHIGAQLLQRQPSAQAAS